MQGCAAPRFPCLDLRGLLHSSDPPLANLLQLVKPLRHNELRHIWTRVWWWRKVRSGNLVSERKSLLPVAVLKP
eukprot:scaffold36745_cov19-Tisochrysis_lutea.AAC.1